MKRIVYWSCFTLVFVTIALGWLSWLLFLVGIRWRAGIEHFNLMTGIFPFNSLVPRLLVIRLSASPAFFAIYTYLSLALDCIMTFLVLRRIWLLLSKKEGTPESFRGLPKGLGYLGIAVLAIFISVTILTSMTGLGMLVLFMTWMILFFHCIPWAFFLTEVFSIVDKLRAQKA